MGEPIFPLEEVVRATATGAATQEVWTDVVLPGWTWVVTGYSFEDETTALTAIRAMKGVAGYPLMLEEQLAPSAGVLYNGDMPAILGEGSSFGARFDGATAADALALYVIGVKLPPGTALTVELLAALKGGGPHA